MITRRRCCPTARCWWQGDDNGSAILASAELYDPASGTLERPPAASPPHAISHGDVAAQRQGARGRGSWIGGSLTSAELYDPAERDLDVPPAASPPHAIVTRRRCCPTARCSSREDLTAALSASAELYDVGLGFISRIGSRKSPRRLHR